MNEYMYTRAVKLDQNRLPNSSRTWVCWLVYIINYWILNSHDKETTGNNNMVLKR